jgi:hypothetical protein
MSLKVKAKESSLKMYLLIYPMHSLVSYVTELLLQFWQGSLVQLQVRLERRKTMLQLGSLDTRQIYQPQLHSSAIHLSNV